MTESEWVSLMCVSVSVCVCVCVCVHVLVLVSVGGWVGGCVGV